MNFYLDSKHKYNRWLNRRLPNRDNPAPAVDIPGGHRALVFYRYVSWALTSLFFLMSPPAAQPVFKLGMVLALLVAGWIAVRLYGYSKATPVNLAVLVTIETLGIAFLLIPTGGLESPFMWYALNPIFMAASLLPGLYSWGVLAVFMAAATAGSIYFSSPGVQLTSPWQEHSWLLLVFLLLTTAAQVFARLIRQLCRAYEELNHAHQLTGQSLEHISNLYQTLEEFSGGEDPGRLANLLADYARKLTGSPVGYCYLVQGNGQHQWEISDPEGTLSGGDLQSEVKSIWHRWREEQAQIDHLPGMKQDPAHQLTVVPVKSTGNLFGILGYWASTKQIAGEERERALTFLAELGAMVLERCKAEDLAAQLLVAEEQNRIANEIHDGVSQHLFSIVYALHALGQKKAHLQNESIQRQLSLIKKTANTAARELHASIYRISPRRRGEQVFVAGVASYLDGLAQLNNINVDLQAEGSEEALSPALRKALYRIIRESTSNAVRHGKCGNIKLVLQMAPGKVFLRVTDNGKGFNIQGKNQNGLGLTNMQNMMASFKGCFTIQSEPGKGTIVTCVVPGDGCKDYETVLTVSGGVQA